MPQEIIVWNDTLGKFESYLEGAEVSASPTVQCQWVRQRPGAAHWACAQPDGHCGPHRTHNGQTMGPWLNPRTGTVEEEHLPPREDEITKEISRPYYFSEGPKALVPVKLNRVRWTVKLRRALSAAFARLAIAVAVRP